MTEAKKSPSAKGRRANPSLKRVKALDKRIDRISETLRSKIGSLEARVDFLESNLISLSDLLNRSGKSQPEQSK